MTVALVVVVVACGVVIAVSAIYLGVLHYRETEARDRALRLTRDMLAEVEGRPRPKATLADIERELVRVQLDARHALERVEKELSRS